MYIIYFIKARKINNDNTTWRSINRTTYKQTYGHVILSLCTRGDDISSTRLQFSSLTLPALEDLASVAVTDSFITILSVCVWFVTVFTNLLSLITLGRVVLSLGEGYILESVSWRGVDITGCLLTVGDKGSFIEIFEKGVYGTDRDDLFDGLDCISASSRCLKDEEQLIVIYRPHPKPKFSAQNDI